MLTIVRDVSLALRDMRRRPGIPLVIVLSLGAAMGLTTSLFSIVNAMWFRPWRVPDAHELRVVSTGIAQQEWEAWRNDARSFAALAAERRVVARIAGQVTIGSFVSANYFDVLRIGMHIGRGLEAADDRDAGATRVIISHDLWQTRLGGDPDIVGRLLPLDTIAAGGPRVRVTIVGVTAQGFEGTDHFHTQIWMPFAAAPAFDVGDPRQPADAAGRTRRGEVKVFGRLAPGTSEERAEAELRLLSERFHDAHEPRHASLQVHGTDQFSQSPPSLRTMGPFASLLLGIVFIALVAAANVSNLLLARGHARRGEIAIRLALGDTRRRVMQGLLTEGLMLAVAASAIGVAIASWLPDAVFREFIAQTTIGNLLRVTFPIDWRVLAWSVAIAGIACIAFGLLPAWRCTRITLAEVMKDGQHNTRTALWPSIIGYQAIVSVMAMAIAGFMLRSAPVREARALADIMSGVTVVRLDPSRDVDPRQQAREHAAIVEALRTRLETVAGQPNVAGLAGEIRAGVSQTLQVTPGYFGVTRQTTIAGRAFAASDDASRVMVINDIAARRLWPERDPRASLGMTIAAGQDGLWDASLVGRQVIGIVAGGAMAMPAAYVQAAPDAVRTWLVRASHAVVAREATRLMASRWPDTMPQILTGAAWVSQSRGPATLAAWTTATFGLLALVLGTVGLFSVLDYAVQQRTREIGIRRALGARPLDIIRSIAATPARPLVRGIIVGSLGAACTGFFMRRADLPASVDPLDPAIYVAVAAGLLAAAACAAALPARRALRIQPARALRVD